ncbi:MAG TPA: aminotransferase class I/II-fold pyridoxal phosphate-dependent enzyme [Myxococcota bacterium]|nr:aminotransferase class I/II-fold pyridoxal phosphate-dependent enzyme [Myxococcota bacterium]
MSHNITGASAVQIASSVEASVRSGSLAPGAQLPTVRALADTLRVSPTTVAAAYRSLRQRGLVVAAGRRGSAVSPHPPLGPQPAARIPAHARDLLSGNPDPALLPALAPALRAIDTTPVLYGEPVCEPGLLATARESLAADGIPVEAVTIVSGALDGLERALVAWLRPGDRVAVEDPGFPAVFHLLSALGLTAVPVGVDDAGPLARDVERALRSGVSALIVTTRAQNPFGSALDERRARELSRLLRAHPELLVLEDDHGGAVAGAPARTLCGAHTPRWAVVRSVSKSLGPDLRLAFLAGDPTTVARVEGRLSLGIRWVSHLLQRTVAALLADREVAKLLRRAERGYDQRRQALLAALAAQQIPAHGRSGLSVWIPVQDEQAAAQALLADGYAVATGSRFRIRSGPALRVTISTLAPEEAPPLARALARALRPAGRSHSV